MHVPHADVVDRGAWAPGWSAPASPLGTTALEVAAILDAAAALGGAPDRLLRMSDGDERARHRGVSHHTRTALEHTLVPVVVPLPPTVDPAEARRHAAQGPHRRGARRRRAARAAGLRVTTMGRGPDEEPRFFAACGPRAWSPPASSVLITNLARRPSDHGSGRHGQDR